MEEKSKIEFIMCASIKRAKDLFYNKLKELKHSKEDFACNKRELLIRLKNGSEIHFKHDEEQLRGLSVDHYYNEKWLREYYCDFTEEKNQK